MPERRCFILGSGFSKDCGLPLARELTPIVWNAMARRDRMDRFPEARLREPGDFGHERLEDDLRAIKLLFPDCACDPKHAESWPDFEELITALDEATRYQKSFERLTDTKADNWMGHAKKWLMYHLQERMSELTDSAMAAGLDPITRFVQSLDQTADSVISFNWDLLLEIAADELRIPVRYRDDCGLGLRLAKPHGSLNLVDSPKHMYEKTRETATNLFELDKEIEYEDAGQKHVVLRTHDPRQAWIRQAWAPPEFALVVEPNLRKTYDRFWLELQWVRALDMVRAADQIIVIGFSLPPTDLRPRILLQLAKLNRQQPPLFHIVDPEAMALCDRFHKLTGIDAEPFDGTLTQWLQQRPSSND